MPSLKEHVRDIAKQHADLPFSVYSSVTDQHILNVPIVKPLLICVLSGKKELGENLDAICRSGDFIFLANTPKIDMRNISQGSEYFALLIEFDYQDFEVFSHQHSKSQSYFTGEISPLMQQTLMQFIEWAPNAPQQLWPHRRQELLQLIYHLGYKQVCSLAEPPSLTHRIEKIITANKLEDISADYLARSLAMSESTLRRKLTAENTSFQAIKDRVKLGYGLHLLQSSEMPIGLIAEQCGYLSQSRFTDKFKSLFGLTPSELRRTRMREMGE